MSAETMSAPLSAAPALSCFCVEGQDDAGLLPRVLELFAKRGLVPERFFAQRSHVSPSRSGRPGLVIDLQVSGFSRAQREIVAESLRQIPLVTAVLTSEKLS
ncbi:MAG: hypothetical protein AAFY02_13570 [Pseudomonadota bacterium]